MHKHGLRSSEWRVIFRCLEILRRLMRGHAKPDDLLEIIITHARADGEQLSRDAARKRFESDRVRLKTKLGCDFQYNRALGEYEVLSIEGPLFDVPPEAMKGLAFLHFNFSQPGVPMYDEVKAFFDILKMLLPAARRRELERQQRTLEIELAQRDSDDIPDDVFAIIMQACNERRQLEFEYLAPRNTDGMYRRHLTEPYRYFFDTVRGHYYLEAYNIEVCGPHGVIQQQTMRAYRLGRIRTPKLLPTHFPGPRRVREVELTYDLIPEIVRGGITQHFKKMDIYPHPDGSATVKARSDNLFFDLRTLLRYGPGCRVTGGEEALREMKAIIAAMAQRYANPEEQ